MRCFVFHVWCAVKSLFFWGDLWRQTLWNSKSPSDIRELCGRWSRKDKRVRQMFEIAKFFFKATFQPLPFNGASWYQRKVKRWNQESDSMNICGDIVVMFNWNMKWSLMNNRSKHNAKRDSNFKPMPRTGGGWVGLWNCGILLNAGEFHCHASQCGAERRKGGWTPWTLKFSNPTVGPLGEKKAIGEL